MLNYSKYRTKEQKITKTAKSNVEKYALQSLFSMKYAVIDGRVFVFSEEKRNFVALKAIILCCVSIRI